MGHRGIRVLKWSSTRSDRCALGSGGSGGRCAQNSQGYQRHPPPGRAQNARLTSTPHLPHLWNGNTPTLSLTWLHEGTVSAAITEARMLYQEAAPLMGHCHIPTAMPEPLLKGFCLNLNQPQAATILTFISGTFPALGDMHHKAPWRKAWVTLIFQIYFMENCKHAQRSSINCTCPPHRSHGHQTTNHSLSPTSCLLGSLRSKYHSTCIYEWTVFITTGHKITIPWSYHQQLNNYSSIFVKVTLV